MKVSLHAKNILLYCSSLSALAVGVSVIYYFFYFTPQVRKFEVCMMSYTGNWDASFEIPSPSELCAKSISRSELRVILERHMKNIGEEMKKTGTFSNKKEVLDKLMSEALERTRLEFLKR